MIALLGIAFVSRISAQVQDSGLFSSTRSDVEPAWRDQTAGTFPLPADSTGASRDVTAENVLMELDVPGLISVSRLSGNGVIYGLEVLQGYGWQHDASQAATSGGVSALRPYAGVFHAGHRDHFIAEYEPTIDLFNKDAYDGRVLHRAGFNWGRLLSRRLTWYLSAHSIDGPAALTDLGILSLGLQTYALPDYSYFSVSNSTGLVWRQTLRHQISFSVADSYTGIHHGPSDAAYSTRIQTTNGFGSRDSEWFLYAQANRNTSQPDCTRVGYGGGVSIGVSNSTRFGLEGGPEYMIGTCATNLRATFAGFLHQRLLRWTLLTLGAKRILIEPTLIQSSYVDEYSGEFQQRLTRTTRFAAGASYIKASNAPRDPLAGYRGFLFSSQIHWQMSKTLSLVPTYQYFKRESPAQENLPDKRSWVFINLLWHPKGTTELVNP